MGKFDNAVLVDCEATGDSPYSGELTEFGAVHFGSRQSFHGVLWDSVPDPANPAKPVIIGKSYPIVPVMQRFADWLKTTVGNRPVFTSDNPAYDFMWIAYAFDKGIGHNPFGHSGRRISDFWAGLQRDWSQTQKWKRFRITPHTHHPVDDSMGNLEALEKIATLI